MPDMRFFPQDDAGRVQWLNNFAGKLRGYAAALRLSEATVAQVETDARVFAYVNSVRNMFDSHAQALTAWRNAVRSGDRLSDFPVPPALEPPPVGAQPGIFKRASRLAQRIKAESAYQPNIGVDLGIIAPPKRKPDDATLKPEIKLIARPGMKPVIKWKKRGLSGVIIEVDRGDGTFTYLTRDSNPDYIDDSQLPPPGTAIIWHYRAIYLRGDNRVGQWSNIVSAPVSG